MVMTINMNTTLFEKITKFPPSWACETIKHWDEIFPREHFDLQNFVTHEVFESRTNVDMRQLVGQWDHFAGQTWLEAIVAPRCKPSSMTDVLRLYEMNPSYYFNGEVDGGIYLSSMNGGPWYSDFGGNHRAVVAKFACEQMLRENGFYPMVEGVEKHFYYANLEAFALFKQLSALHDKGIHVYVERKQVGVCLEGKRERIDYHVTFFIADHRFGRRMRSQRLEINEFLTFARHVISKNAIISKMDRVRDFLRSDAEGLIY